MKGWSRYSNTYCIPQKFEVTSLRKSFHDEAENLLEENQSVLEAPSAEYSMYLSKVPLLDLISILIYGPEIESFITHNFPLYIAIDNKKSKSR